MSFDEVPFRKLKSIDLVFAERITLIAGHNGIGKSTLLGLIANASGLSRGIDSYFGRKYQGNLNEIIHLDIHGEVEMPRSEGRVIPSPTLTYQIDEEELVKRSALTVRSKEKRVRVVPRNDPHEEFESGEGVRVGKDAKVPLPTIFLGMTRMLPIGECDPENVESMLDKGIEEEDAHLIREFVDHVIHTGRKSADVDIITTQGIKGTKKTAKHPGYAYDARCISLGQDSLSAIATAIASFNRLAREDKSYPGGLLVVDEIDAGLHPKAQAKLIDELAKHAKRLKLQIVATTHSLSLIEHIHPDTKKLPPQAKVVDSVIYLTDSISPHVADSYTLEDIKRDMNLTLPPVPGKKVVPVLPVYLEDQEAAYVFDTLLDRKLIARLKKEAGVRLKPQAIFLGCENLKKLHSVVGHFREVIVCLDGDSTPPKKAPNFVSLPGAKQPSKTLAFNPERTLHGFIEILAGDGDSYPTARAELAKIPVNRDYLREYFLVGDYNIEDRDSAKRWMVGRLQLIKDWKLYNLWAAEHSDLVRKFQDDLVAAAVATAGYAD